MVKEPATPLLLEHVHSHLCLLDVALALLGLFVFCCVRAKLKNDGPMIWPVFGITLEFFLQMRDVYGWITRSLKKSGGTFSYHGVWGGGSYGAVTCLPWNIEYMLKTNFKNYPKGKFYRERFSDLLEDGIFNADDDSWKEQRRITITEMHSTRFVDHSFRTTQDLIAKKLLRVMDSLAMSQEPFDLQDMLLRLTFDNICIAGLGADPGSLAIGLPNVPFARAFEEATESTLFRFMIPPFVWKPMRFLDIGYEKGLRKAVETVHEFVDKIVQDRITKLKEDGTLDNQSDFLSRVIQIESQQKGHVKGYSTVQFFRQFCTSFILAGRDTSSVALSWFFWVIQEHPEVENKIITEIREILRRRENLPVHETESTTTFTVRELNDMVYLQAALSEALRIHPPIPMEMKEALEDDAFPDGTFIRKGSRIYFSIYAMGRMESIWGKDCELFKPERWIQAGQFVGEDPYKFVVFNAGPRLCLGRTFAYLQMKMVAASILWRYSIKVVPGHVVFPRVTTTLYMKHGLKVTVKPRLHK
ncbi:PREDICTED: cytochrome P450 86B1-like [Tarenaya hassleriana]|uniref:cytochrome P450 86B1-like n=1 Tax=Tarenaya hassleriana TaxID=28532 RepID=UPI00053C9619|nr:PREDICTED: cytochrome P450 86B1-like [Tarenaya hassleriana]